VPRPSKGRRHWALALLGHVAVFLLTIVIAIAAVVGVTYVRISHGPISLKFLGASIQKGINSELIGFEAQLDDALLALSPHGSLELRLTNLRLVEPDGDMVATVPTAAVELSQSALWGMKLVPSRIDLIEPRLFLYYGSDTGLALSFVRPGQDPPRSPLGQQGIPTDPASRVDPPHRVKLADLITQATQRARKRVDSSAFLNQIGVRNAVVTLDNLGVRSEWRIIEGAIDFDHRKRRSIASGHAMIADERGPWTLTVRSEDSEKDQNLKLHATLKDLAPRSLGLAIPQLSLLETLDAPVNAEATIDFAANGDVSVGTLQIGLGRGQFRLPSVGDVTFGLDQGQLAVSYDGAAGRVDLHPSTLVWGNSRVSIAGAATSAPTADGRPAWTFDIGTVGGQLSGDDFNVPAVAVDKGILRGHFVSQTGEVRVDQLAFQAGGAELQGTGQFLTGVDPAARGARFDAKLGPMAVDTVKALWPRALAKGARIWVGERVKRGTLKGGTLRFVSGTFAREAGVPASAVEQRRLTFAAEATDLMAMPLKWLSPVEAPRALIRLEDNSIEVTIPDAAIVLAPNRRVPIKMGRFSSTNLEIPISTAEITYRTLAPLVPILEVLDQSPLRLLKSNGVTTEGIDGKVDGQMKLSLPLINDLDAKDVKIEAKVKVIDGKAKQLAGAYDVQSAAIAVDITDASVTAAGDMLVNGVPVKLGWQRILEDNGEKQPPLRLSATLDNADRNQLGIDINHILQGEVPVEILIEKGPTEEPSVRLRADLTNADIGLESIAWHKPPGRAATLQADIVKGKTYKTELQNLRVAGDDIAIEEGTASISADNKLREIHLPGFTLNVISRLDVHAILKADGADKGIWQVKVKGSNFDGRDLFRSLFSVGAVTERQVKTGKPGAGIDIDAEVDNVIGHGEVSLRGLKMRMSRRADKMTFLDARATLDGGGPLALSMNPQGGERRLLADTTDAGQAFKLIGFYPNMQAGRARIEINLDGSGAAEKTGTLWVEEFTVLGDPIVSEVLGSATVGDDGKPIRTGRKKAAERETFSFNTMKVPFSVGYGQFVLKDAYLRGPLIGVNLVGKADFKLKSLDLGGTYIPAQGLNNAFGGVPLVGDIVSGPRNEGAFGITFAVQGPMARPQVLVNPLSLVAPGIFRELFQMTNPNPKVIARDEKGPTAPVEQRVRAASPPAAEPDRPKGPRRAKTADEPRAVDGWTSQTVPQKR
jgi:hypothetical protein